VPPDGQRNPTSEGVKMCDGYVAAMTLFINIDKKPKHPVKGVKVK
jgi:hypothetical protein